MIPLELETARQTRKQTLEMTGDLPQERLDSRSKPEVWSVGEVMDHLIRTEGFYIEQIEALVELAKRGERPFRKLRFADLDVTVAPIPKSAMALFEVPLTVMSYFTPKKLTETLARSRFIKFENPESAAPVSGRLKEELLEGLRASSGRMAAIFEAHPEIDYTRLKLRHPLLGTNTVVDILRFAGNHEARHQAQIRDILAAFPERSGTEGRPE